MNLDESKTSVDEAIRTLENTILSMEKRSELLEEQIKQMKIKLKSNKSKKTKKKKGSATSNKETKTHFTDGAPENPYGTKISGILKEGIEFYWKKLERADGYEVYRSYGIFDEPKKIAEITQRSIGTYIDSDFDHSKKKVFYSVRSYLKQSDGSVRYSELSAPKEAHYRDELVLERDATYMYSGSSRKIRAIYGWGEPNKVDWVSDNKMIASVDEDGTINAISSGSCTIKCICKSIGQTAETKVVVDRKACKPLKPITSKYNFNKKTNCWENFSAPDSGDAVIMMVGDMMCGKKQMDTQYTDKEGWNFNDSFEFVKDITATADLSVANLETLLAAGWPYMTDEAYINNYNNCNATSRYLDAVKYGGFDAVMMANNHNCDGGVKALNETIEQVDKYNFARTGAFKDSSEDRFLIVNVNGIKVGFLAYISKSTGFNQKEADWSKKDKNVRLNIFSEKRANKDIADCRKAGAEYVIAYMHWGFKNHRNIAKHQYLEAQAVADAGADYIVGSNPHVLQKYKPVITKTGKLVPCAYSVGNFQSIMNQVPGNRDSIILRIRLVKDERGKVILKENNYIPCFTYTNLRGCRWATISVGDKFNNNIKAKNRNQFCDRIVETIGSDIDQF